MTLLLIQMTTVLLTALFCGWIARKLGQSRVIGEIIGGILVGPSVFGRIAPHASSVLFPPSSLGSFEVLSTIGLILFLFLIGSELDYEHLRKQKATATLASGHEHSLPVHHWRSHRGSFPAHSLRPARHRQISFRSLPWHFDEHYRFSCARPHSRRAAHASRLRSERWRLMCAAVDDVCAWSLLAVALTLLPHAGQSTPLGYRLLWLGAYLAVMLGIIRPLGAFLVKRQKSISLSYELLGIIVAGGAGVSRRNRSHRGSSSLRSLPRRRLLPTHRALADCHPHPA